MVDQFVVNFLSNLSIPPLNGDSYTEIDEAHANYAMILTIILMISIFIIWS